MSRSDLANSCTILFFLWFALKTFIPPLMKALPQLLGVRCSPGTTQYIPPPAKMQQFVLKFRRKPDFTNSYGKLIEKSAQVC
jgi:hypothetical protein